jgi:hypothetical protein
MNSKLKTQNSKLKILGFINGKTLFTLLITLVAAYCSLFTVQAQRRDHLTAEEIELVRDAQQIDHRMEVFVKAIERRFSVLNNAAPTKKPEKDADKWGELPTGTRQQLLTDIEKLLDEAISKIDDVAARDIKAIFSRLPSTRSPTAQTDFFRSSNRRWIKPPMKKNAAPSSARLIFAIR